jgi:ATP/ADP translocase
MNTIKQLAGAEFRGLRLLLVTYGALMMHFIYGRVFRDSLLGSHLRIQSLPSLTLWGTLVSIIASLTVSALLRSKHRTRTARTMYAINAVVELFFAFSYGRSGRLYSLFFIVMSASTIVGLSMIWILIGDWASSHEANRKRLIPAVLLYGTAISILAGVGLTHLRIAASFRCANLILAAMNTISIVALTFYRNEGRFSGPGIAVSNLPNQTHRNHKLLRTFAALTVVAAATSTLLDLMFRIRVVERFPHEVERLHFLGLFQSLLSLSAFLSQIALGRVLQKKLVLTIFHLHPAAVCIASCLLAFAPGFWPFAFLRNSEYSLRNSLFRFGTEMAYARFPDHERAIVVRPLIDVIGERLGDLCASGVLAFLLFVNPQLPVALGLLLLAMCSLLFWRICRSLERSMSVLIVKVGQDAAATRDDQMRGMAHENAGIA